jgi:hypothetical protein
LMEGQQDFIDTSLNTGQFATPQQKVRMVSSS